MSERDSDAGIRKMINYNDPGAECSLQPRGRLLKSGKPVKQCELGQSFDISRKLTDKGNTLPSSSSSSSSMRNHRKPWPSRKVTGLEDVVKNISSDPCYLQCSDQRGDDVQEKAFNFGVLDWRTLEKWTYLQKQVANRGDGNCPSSNDLSSSLPFSAVGSLSRSAISRDTPLAQREHEPVQSKLTKERKCGKILQFSESRDAHTTVPSAPRSHENGKCIRSDMKSIDKSKASDGRWSGSTTKGYNTLTYDVATAQIVEPKGVGKSKTSEEQRISCNLRLVGCSDLKEQCSVIEGMWDHLQENANRARTSCDSAVASKIAPAGVNCSSFPGILPAEEVPCTKPFGLSASHSCPLPRTIQSGEPLVACPPLFRDEVAARNNKGKHHLLTDGSSEHFAASRADRSGQNEVKLLASLRRELSPHRLLRAGINRIRSSSLREGSPGQQMKQTSRSSHEHDEPACTRGRRSPLRRLLDPLLKSNGHSKFSGPIASSPNRQAQDINNSDKRPIPDELELANGRLESSDECIKSSVGLSPKFASPVQDGKSWTSARQALLKLSWKNGFPLFMFSSSDNNILAATMRRRSTAEKNGFECVYTLFSAREMKKIGGIWKGQGSNVKRQGLVYNVVGQMKVYSSKVTAEDSKTCYLVREFVLFGSQLVPTKGHEPVCSVLNNELAAIVVKVPVRSTTSFELDRQRSSHCCTSSQADPAEDRNSCYQVENSSLSSIVAILPSGAHGLSTVGEAPPLIRRWQLGGGSCDCGGWDEGCMLTVLTNKTEETSGAGAAQSSTRDGTHRVELFNQGKARTKEHAFTVVALKEGVYTVEFGASVAFMQAFAICIATLHSWKPTSLAELHHSVEACRVQEDHTLAAGISKGRHGPTNYVPYHPPPSPIGRT